MKAVAEGGSEGVARSRIDRSTTALMKQTSLASLTYTAKKKKTRKEWFLEQMESCVPWARFEAVIEPY